MVGTGVSAAVWQMHGDDLLFRQERQGMRLVELMAAGLWCLPPFGSWGRRS